MRAWKVIAALQCALTAVGGAAGAALERQPRLAAGRPLLLPEPSEPTASNTGISSSGGSVHPVQPTQDLTAAAAAKAGVQQQQHWWQRLWPWRRWGGGSGGGSSSGGSDPEQLIRVLPVRPDGSLAAAAELRLPASQIASEGLRPLANPPGGGAAIAGSAAATAVVVPTPTVLPGGAPGRGPYGAAKSTAGASASAASPGAQQWSAASNGYYTYNSSEMTPLVPLWLSWMTDLERMANRSQGLDFQTAWTLSSYVAISYCNVSGIAAWNCTRCGKGISAGFIPQQVVFDAAWDLLGYVGYSQTLDGIVVAFRGTDSHSIYNWVNNMRTWRTDLALGYPGAPQGTLVHGGFFYSYNGSSLAANITAAVQALRARHPRSPVYVTGHSLGGALATLCALDIRLNLGAPDVRVYTFGSPRVGNQIFAQWFESLIKVHWRFTHNRDIVPSVPPGYMGFYHVSREIWLVDLIFGHTLVGICDGTGEDMLCHNSMCHLGLCSSVSDHLLYLSEMYSPHPQGC